MQHSVRLKQVVFLDQSFANGRARSRPLPHLAALDEQNLTFYIETISGANDGDEARVQLQAVSSFVSVGISRIEAVPRRHWISFGDSIDPQEFGASFLCCAREDEHLQVIGFPLGTSSGTPVPKDCFQCKVGKVIDFSFCGPFLVVLTETPEFVLWEVEMRHSLVRLTLDGRPKFCCGLGGWAMVVVTEEATFHVVPLLDISQGATSQPLEVAYPSLFSSESVPAAMELISTGFLIIGMVSGGICAVDPADMRLRFASNENHSGAVTYITEYSKTNSFCSLSIGEVRFWDSDTFALKGRVADSALCGVVGVGSLRNHLYFAMAQNEFITPDLNLELGETEEKTQVVEPDAFSPTRLIRTINELQSNIVVTSEIQSSLASTVHRLTEELREANDAVTRLQRQCETLEREKATREASKDSPPESSQLELEFCLQRISELEGRLQEPSFLHSGLVAGTSGYPSVPESTGNAEPKGLVLPGSLMNGTDALLSQLRDDDSWHILPRTIQDSILTLKELLRVSRAESTPSHPTLMVASVVSPGRQKERPQLAKCDKCEELKQDLEELKLYLQKETTHWKTYREKLETDLMVAQEKESSQRNWIHAASFALSEKQILLDEAQAFNTSLMATVDCLYLDRLAEVSVSATQRVDPPQGSNGTRDTPAPTPSGVHPRPKVVSPAFESSPLSGGNTLRSDPSPNEEGMREQIRLLEYLLECGKQKDHQQHSSTLTASYTVIKENLGLEKANRYLLKALKGGTHSEHDAILSLISSLCALDRRF